MLGEGDPDRRRVEQREEACLLGVIGAGGVAEGGADAAELLVDELGRRERLGRAVAPVPPRALVEELREGLRQPIGERLDQDRGVVVPLGGEARGELPRRRARGDREGPDVIGDARAGGGDEVREAQAARLGVARRLLPQAGEPRELSVRAASA
jgi:hypothetical protein